MVDSKENNVNMVNSNDKVAMMVDLKVSTTDDLKNDTALVDLVVLGKRILSNIKTKPTEIKYFFMEPRKKS